MKFVFITSRSLDRIGGIETYMLNMCKMLNQHGHRVVLYTFSEQRFSKSNFFGIELINIRSQPNRFFEKIIVSFKATIHVLRFHSDADIIHYNAMAAGLFSWIPIICRKKVVFQGHGFEWQRAKWSKNARRIIKFLDAFCLWINQNIIMVSEDQSNYVRDHFHKTAITITPGVNVNFNFEETDVIKRFNLIKNSYFLYLGRLVPEKKADLLIEAFIRSGILEKKLVIAGDDPFSREYIAQLKKCKSDSIEFTGTVYGDDKETLLENCLAFCIPSELEGLPITLLEAMSHRKICIASDIPANREALGENGVFFKCNCVQSLINRLCDVSLHPENFRSKGSENFERVNRKFSWEKISDEYETYCKSIAQVM